MSKPLWTFILILSGALALWRGTVGGLAYWNYQRLSTAVPGQVRSLQVVPNGSKYALQASYSYGFQGKTYAKKTLLAKPYYLNRSSAESAASQLKGMDWQVYLDPRKPSFSALDLHFPLKEVFYGICLIGVFLYFVYLRVHLEFLSKEM